MNKNKNQKIIKANIKKRYREAKKLNNKIATLAYGIKCDEIIKVR